jgi:hypothetical protein
MEPSWSLHLLSEILSAFSTDDPENLRNVVNRVAESVEAEVAAILGEKGITWSIGLGAAEQQLLLQATNDFAGELCLQIACGALQLFLLL